MHLNRKNRLESMLNEQFKPSHIEVLNESYMHRVPEHSQTHFKVVLVCEMFENTSVLQRHKMVYQLTKPEMANGLHALSLHLYTPAEWQSLQSVPSTPQCAHHNNSHES